jgi:hypothetical protein
MGYEVLFDWAGPGKVPTITGHSSSPTARKQPSGKKPREHATSPGGAGERAATADLTGVGADGESAGGTLAQFSPVRPSSFPSSPSHVCSCSPSTTPPAPSPRWTTSPSWRRIRHTRAPASTTASSERLDLS